ncbi:DeoR/GlpR family transcriptional regulator of sugar metabolism [Bacillus mesophilus]|uniref:DeoR/GlpR transcriptional regulator n=1 Tax=Bacillus mesophilus TaxID=1808955 RepID=A0A6M0QD35_9BACI|nr:DeoR/GlpR family DNA-binding transcription regulator [Bacillus mesophilus]MBM7662870.1 DeoR/GlpR family transcriptional regulator of sugar metabolism [Bacillus mesophilus]NEY73460.1 DeoR/GlpR transcriptional regulator [Bacillus mesophilus]
MLQEERQKLILTELKEHHSVRIANLCKKLGVTRETIRRDLHELEESGHLKKVHGGAVQVKASLEPSYQKRELINTKEKESLAKKAASLIEDGDAVYFDIGTTTLLIPKFMKEKKNVTVITNGVKVAMALAECPGVKVILTGGEMRVGEMALSGATALKTIEPFYIDKAFIGVGGIDSQVITDYHLEEKEIRRMMVEKATTTFALADYSKFGTKAFVQVCPIEEIHTVICDGKAPKDMIVKLQEKGVNVIVVREVNKVFS